MGVVNLKAAVYNKDIQALKDHDAEKQYITEMSEDRKILAETMKRMYKRILNSENCPAFNIEGAVEAIVMRNVYSAMSLVRYEMKNYSKEKED